MSDRTNNPAAWPDSKVAHACAFFAAALESMLVRERSFMANPDLEVREHFDHVLLKAQGLPGEGDAQNNTLRVEP